MFFFIKSTPFAVNKIPDRLKVMAAKKRNKSNCRFDLKIYKLSIVVSFNPQTKLPELSVSNDFQNAYSFSGHRTFTFNIQQITK